MAHPDVNPPKLVDSSPAKPQDHRPASSARISEDLNTMASLKIDEGVAVIEEPVKTSSTSAAKAAYNKRKKEAARKRKAEALQKEAEIKAASIPLDGIAGLKIEIKESPGKGLGLFATRDIKAASEIFREVAMIKSHRPWLHIEAGIQALSDAKKTRFMALYGYCQCKKSPCIERDTQKIWDNNSFEVDEIAQILTPRYRKISLYEVASRINHSCIPNCQRRFSPEGDFVLFASRDIKQGEELTQVYINTSGPAAQRRQKLLDKFGFTCQCQGCIDGINLTGQALREFSVIPIKVPANANATIIGKHSAEEAQVKRALQTWWLWWERSLEEAEVEVRKLMHEGLATGQILPYEEPVAVIQNTLKKLHQNLVARNDFGVGRDIIDKYINGKQSYYTQVALDVHREMNKGKSAAERAEEKLKVYLRTFIEKDETN